MNWIKIKEELPERDVWVQIRNAQKRKEGTGMLSDIGWIFSNDFNYCIMPSHWRPLFYDEDDE